MERERARSLAVFVLTALASLSLQPAWSAECKQYPVEVNFCAVQKPNEVAVQDRTIRLWQAAAGRKYGGDWNSWSEAKGRIRCRLEGGRTCCQAAAIPCRK